MSRAATTRRPQPRRWRWLVAVLVVLAGVGVVALWLVVRGQQAADALTAARAGVTQIRQAIQDGDIEQAQQLLPIVQADTARAADVTGDPVFAVTSALPVVGNTPAAVRSVSRAADDLATTVLPELIDAGAALDPTALRTSGDQINLAAFEKAAPQLSDAVSSLTQISEDVAGIETARTPAQVSDAVTSLQTQVDDVLAATTSAARGAELLPPMLGGDGKRRYLLAFQSNNEARGTGGFFGSYGVASADNGRVRIDELSPRSKLDEHTYDSLPLDFGDDYAALYGDDPATWAGANMSPHYPYAAQLWLQMWQDRSGGERLDGVLTTDPVTLSYLLEATGPVVLDDGREITADNVVEFTENEVYFLFPVDDVARDAYLQQISEAALDAVLSGQAEPRALADALGRAAGERRLLLYSDHKAEQALLTDAAVGGVIPDDAAPFAGLALINGGGNKLDYYLRHGMTYELIGCEPDGSRRTQITVDLANTAPDSGLPLYIDGRSDLGTRPNGVPRDANGDHFLYAQVFTTQGATLVAAKRDGQPLAVDQGKERGRPVYRAGVEIEAGDRTSLTFELLEPATEGEVSTFVTPLVKPGVVSADDTQCGSG